MHLSVRDRLFICGVGLAVVVACALITLTRPAEAKQAAVNYKIVTAHRNVTCPHPYHVVGGGGKPVNDTSGITDVWSYPTHQNGWMFQVKSNGHYVETTAYAICEAH